MSMSAYRKKVREAARAKNGKPLTNDSIDHAAVLAEHLFEFGSREVCVFAGDLNAHVYGDSEVLEKARQFIAVPDRKVRVLVQNKEKVDWTDHPFVACLRSSSDVSFRTLSPDFSPSYHFIVTDGDSYRFEEDNNQPTAVAAFGDPNGGARLHEVFDLLWDGSPNDPLAEAVH